MNMLPPHNTPMIDHYNNQSIPNNRKLCNGLDLFQYMAGTAAHHTTQDTIGAKRYISVSSENRRTSLFFSSLSFM